MMSPILKRQGLFLCLGVTGFLLGACNPYERRVGEYNAGGVDPIKFPSAYLGAGGNPKRSGSGSFQYVLGYVDGNPLIYYPLAFNGKQDTAADPSGKCKRYSNPLDVAVVSPSYAYVFDAKKNPTTGAIVDTAPDSDQCVKPDGYMFDRQRDAVRFDRQGNIFTKLPADSDPVGCTAYVPIVNEVPVVSNGEPCQDIKSEKLLVTRSDVQAPLDPPPDGVTGAMPTGHPSDRYLAYALIDPGADVQPPSCPADGSSPCQCPPEHPELCKLDAVTGLGPQRWGWYQQYLTAYLDGGYIPIANPAPADCKSGKCFQPQKLYYPLVWDDEGSAWTDQGFGNGRDVMEVRRGSDGYSPICEVWSFQPADKDPNKSELKAADIKNLTPAPTSTGQYVYCLQTP